MTSVENESKKSVKSHENSRVIGVIRKIANFIVGDSISMQLDQYIQSFSYLVNNTADSIKEISGDNTNVISKIIELRNINKKLLDRLFRIWRLKNRQLLFFQIALLVINLILLVVNGDTISKLANAVMDIFGKSS